MPPFGRRAKGLAAVALAFAVVYGYLITRPLTPEAARAALGERFPELRDEAIVGRADGTYAVGDCRFNLAAAAWWFDPPRPHPDPRLRPLFPTYKQSDGLIQRDTLGRWRTIETSHTSICVGP